MEHAWRAIARWGWVDAAAARALPFGEACPRQGYLEPGAVPEVVFPPGAAGKQQALPRRPLEHVIRNLCAECAAWPGALGAPEVGA